MQFFGYDRCSTCRKAEKALKEKNYNFKKLDITETPPSKAAFKKALKNGYALKDLFNTSGVLYREMKMKDKIQSLTQNEALDLLATHGKLVKRPIVVDGDSITIGFKNDFAKAWL